MWQEYYLTIRHGTESGKASHVRRELHFHGHIHGQTEHHHGSHANRKGPLHVLLLNQSYLGNLPHVPSGLLLRALRGGRCGCLDGACSGDVGWDVEIGAASALSTTTGSTPSRTESGMSISTSGASPAANIASVTIWWSERRGLDGRDLGIGEILSAIGALDSGVAGPASVSSGSDSVIRVTRWTAGMLGPGVAVSPSAPEGSGGSDSVISVTFLGLAVWAHLRQCLLAPHYSSEQPSSRIQNKSSETAVRHGPVPLYRSAISVRGELVPRVLGSELLPCVSNCVHPV